MSVSFRFTLSLLALVVSNWQELRRYLLSLGPISPSGFGLAPQDRPWRCGWRGLRVRWWRGSWRRLFSPLKLNFSPFQPGPWTRDRARACARLPTLRLLQSYVKKVSQRGERKFLGRNQYHLFCQNDPYVRRNGYLLTRILSTCVCNPWNEWTLSEPFLRLNLFVSDEMMWK